MRGFVVHWTLGHIKWFAEDTMTSYVPSLSTSEWLIVALALTVGIGLMLLVDKLLVGPNKALDARFKQLRDWVPTVIRWSTAGLLIFSYWQGNIYASNIEYSVSVLSSLLNAILITIAILLLLGVYTRVAGATLLVVYFASIFVVNDPIQLLDHLGYIGIGSYLMFTGVGRLSVNEKLIDPLSSSLGKFERLALPLLKTFAGLGLIVLAFSEKLLNMSLANNFLISHSGWNFLSSFGLNDRNFIILAGTVTILLGLSLILNRVTRLSTLALLVTMIITATLLGPVEVTGHLFAVGLVFAVWVGPNKDLWSKRRSS